MKKTDVLKLALEALLNQVNSANNLTPPELFRIAEQVLAIRDRIKFFNENPGLDFKF